MNATPINLDELMKKAKRKCMALITSGAIVCDPEALTFDLFVREIIRATKSAAPGAANTENGKVLGTEITISIDHMEINVKGD